MLYLLLIIGRGMRSIMKINATWIEAHTRAIVHLNLDDHRKITASQANYKGEDKNLDFLIDYLRNITPDSQKVKIHDTPDHSYKLHIVKTAAQKDEALTYEDSERETKVDMYIAENMDFLILPDEKIFLPYEWTLEALVQLMNPTLYWPVTLMVAFAQLANR